MTPEERRQFHNAVRNSMLRDDYGAEVVLPPPKPPRPLRTASMDVGAFGQADIGTTDLVVTGSGVSEYEPPATQPQASQTDSAPAIQSSPVAASPQPFVVQSAVASYAESWNYSPPADNQPESFQHQAQQSPPIQAFTMAAPQEIAMAQTAIAGESHKIDAAPFLTHVSQDTSAPSQPTFNNAPATQFLSQRYGVGANTVDAIPAFTYAGADTSQESAGRPQPSRPGGGGSSPFRLFNTRMPQGDGQIPVMPAKTEQQVFQTSNLDSAIDTGLERLLTLLDSISNKIAYFSQRLGVIESIIDRSE